MNGMHIMLGVKRIRMTKSRQLNIFILPLLYGIVFLISCENDFVLSYDVPSNPVVYSIIDPEDWACYIVLHENININHSYGRRALCATRHRS